MIYNLKEKRTFNLILFSLFFFVFLISSVAALDIGTNDGSGVKIIPKVIETISSFLGLSDTPDSYVGQAGKYVRVNGAENALEFAGVAGGGDFSFVNFQGSSNENISAWYASKYFGNFSFQNFQSSFDSNFSSMSSYLNSTYSLNGSSSGGGNTSWNQSYANTLYSNFTWAFNQSDLDLVYAKYQFTNNNFNGSGNFTTTDGYISGQPITGSIGSGIIWANGTNSFAEIQINCTGLNCQYNAFKVRLVNTTNDEKYCNVPLGIIALNDNQHNVLYVDNNCQVQKTSIQTYIATPISPGGIADFANIIAYGGSTENVNGLGLENKRMIKLRKLLLTGNPSHLSIHSGFIYQLNTFPQFNITSGTYVYLMDEVPTSKQVTGTNNIEVVYHNLSGSWTHKDQTGLNLTSCDTGTSFADCTNVNRYRRIYIFNIGYNDSGTDSTGIHQLLPLESTSYTTVSDCLNTETSPLTYTLPDYYQYGAVLLYAYCGRASDTSWVSSNFIDLRTTRSGSTTAGTSSVNYWTLSGNTLSTLTGNYIVNMNTVNTTNITSYKVNVTDTLWINGINASRWLFNQSERIWGNFYFSNFSNSFDSNFSSMSSYLNTTYTNSIWAYNQTEAVGRSNVTMYPNTVIKYSGGNFIQGYDSSGWYSALT